MVERIGMGGKGRDGRKRRELRIKWKKVRERNKLFRSGDVRVPGGIVGWSPSEWLNGSLGK